MARMGRRWWAVRVREYEQNIGSWDSMLAFCRAKEVNYWTFREWRKRLRTAPVETGPGLVRVDVDRVLAGGSASVGAVPATAPPVMEAELPGAMMLRFRVGTDVEYVAKLVEAMGRRIGC